MEPQSSPPEDPSYINVPIMSWITVALWLLWVFLLVILLLWRRNRQPIKTRSPPLLVLTMFMTSFLVIMSSIRFAVGRYKYPCFLYTMSFFMSQPGIFFPTILRSWRLFFVYRLSVAKSNVAHGVLKGAPMHRTGSSVSATSEEEEEGSQDGLESLPEEKTVELEETAHVNDKSGADTGSNVANVAAVTAASAEKKQDSGKRRSSRLSTHNLRSLSRSIHAYTFWVSMPFLMLLFGAMVLVHAAIWIIFSATDASTYFSFTDGCRMSTVALIITVVQVIVYLAVELVIAIALITVRDQYHMRTEMYVNIFQWFVLVLVFLLIGVIPFVKGLSDKYLPSGFAIFLACFLDTFISIFIPVMMSFRSIYRSSSDHEKQSSSNHELSFVLGNDELRPMFRKYTVESFAPEILLAWEHAERYRNEKNSSRRQRIGHALIRTFLDPQRAVMELNLSAEIQSQYTVAELQNALDKNKAPEDLFVSFQKHCLMDMQDMFNRFRTRTDYVKRKKAIEAQAQLMQEAGMM